MSRKKRLTEATNELLELIDRTMNPSYADVTGEERRLYSIENRAIHEDWSWGSYYDGKMHYSPPAPVAILWEEGPDDWTIELTLGGGLRRYHEVVALQDKYDVLFEPYTSWALGVYDQRHEGETTP